MRKTKQWAIAAMAAAALGLAGCGGGGDSAGGNGPGVETPSAYDKAKAAVNAATTATAVDAAVKAAVDGGLGGSDTVKLQKDAETRKAALKDMAAKTALLKAVADAAGMVDTSDLTTEEKINTAKEKNRDLDTAIKAAEAEGVAASALAAHKTTLANAQKAVTTKVHMNALSAASQRLSTAILALTGQTPTKAQVEEAMAAHGDLVKAITDAGNDEVDTTTYQAQADAAIAQDPDGPIYKAQGHYRDHVVKTLEDNQITEAMNAVKMVTDTSDEDTVTDAQTAIDMATQAIDAANISDAQKQTLKSKLAEHQGALDRAELSRTRHTDNLSRIAGVVREITDGEIKAVMEAIGRITPLSEESAVTDTDAAIAAAEKAIADADIPNPDKNGLLIELNAQKTAFNTAKTDRMKGHAMGAALHAAMTGPTATAAPNNALTNLDEVPEESDALKTSGALQLSPAAGAGTFTGTTAPEDVFFVYGVDSKDEARVAKTGIKPEVNLSVADEVNEGNVTREWYVTRYNKSTGSGEAKVTDRALVHNDRRGGPAYANGVVEFKAKDWFEEHDDDRRDIGTYVPASRKVPINFIVSTAIYAKLFEGTGAGSKTFTPADGTAPNDPKLIMIPGTLYGAPGNYFCASNTNNNNCTMSRGAAGPTVSPISLNGSWYFVHDKDAMVKRPDFDYMVYGWWVRDGADGMPKAVSAFYSGNNGGITGLTTDGISLSGTATFEGDAIGQYAIHDPLHGKGDGGEFKAKVELTAKYGDPSNTSGSGISGMIDTFTLKDGSDPGWSVSLNQSAWVTGPDETKGHNINTSMTTWSIGGIKGAPAGSWQVSLYDESQDTVAKGGDGSDHPTHALGKWQAEHSVTHRMVGAFGAELQQQ